MNICKELYEELSDKISKGEIPRFIYKFCADDENKEKIFTDHTLWFSHPKDFNDPFDCWANIQYVNKKGLYGIAENIPMTNAYKRLYIDGIPKYTKEKHKKDIDIVFNELGICCFSKNFKNILMWSHYAQYHKGFCLQFDILKDPIFFNYIIPVAYVDTMPEYDMFSDIINMLDKTIKPKSKVWEYEEEVRIVKTKKFIETNNSQAFKFNPDSLQKLIFGCKTHKSTIEKYMKLCKKNDMKHVQFSQMIQKTNGSFELKEKKL